MSKRRRRKVPRLFKINPALDARLDYESKKSRRTKTAVVELAMEKWFSSKRKS